MSLARRFNKLFTANELLIGNSKGEIRDLSNWVVEKDVSDPSLSSQGSAFFLKNYGLVTACHCVDGAKSIEIYHPHNPSKRYSAKISKSCTRRDLAILSHSIPNDEFLSLEIFDQPTRTGEEVRILGYPSFGPGSGLQIRDAKIVSHQTKSAVKQIVVDGKINQGNSGGPVVDHFDRVIGIALKGGSDEAIDIAIAIHELKGL